MAGIIYWSLKILQRFLPNSPIYKGAPLTRDDSFYVIFSA
jgi:hypothetical protein